MSFLLCVGAFGQFFVMMENEDFFEKKVQNILLIQNKPVPLHRN